MFGDDGNDFLDGGEDEDIMTGGLGDDTYIVDNVSDLVTEVSEAGSGDTVKASINYTLGASLENLTLTGSSAINGTGNGLNNIITGNSGDNILDGGTGADTVVFNGSSGEYLFSLNETLQLVVTDLIAGRDGKDTLAKAEYLSFNNIQLNASEVIAGKNAPPTDLTLTLTSVGIAENGIAGTLIGTLSATDPDAGSTFSYTLVAGDGTNDADNNLVEIVGSQVKVKIGASIDFETNSTLNLNIKVTDNDTPGLTYTKAVTAAVLNVNDAPTVNAILPLQTINRSSNFSYALPSNLFLDLDSTPTLSATTTTGASLPSWLTFNASTGIFTGTPSSSGTVALNISASDGLTSVSTPLELKIREVQLISSLSKPITYQRNKDLIVPINYSTTDGSKNTGISFNVYFNSSLLSFDATTGIANKVQADLFNVGAIQADTANSDGDSSTDKFIPISLASFSGNFLSNTTPTKLADLTFKAADKSIDPITGLRNTNINFNEIEAAQGYGFSSISAALAPLSFNLDVDGDGKVTALGDGLMVIRKLFGAVFAGDALTYKAVSPNAARTTAEISDFIQQGIDAGMLDVDKDGKTTALGDGLMVIRRLFGAAFDGAPLINKAISPNSPYFGQASDFNSVGINVDALKQVMPLI